MSHLNSVRNRTIEHHKAWSPLTLFACRQRNFSHGTCAECWKESSRTKNIFRSFRIWSSNVSTSAKFSYSKTNQTSFSSHVDILQNGRPTALSGLREDRPHYILKTRIIELQTSFPLRQFFAATLRKYRLIFLPRYFSLTKNSVSDRRKVWMEIRLKPYSSSRIDTSQKTLVCLKEAV